MSVAGVQSRGSDLRLVLRESTNVVAFIGTGLSSNFPDWMKFIEALVEYAEYQEGRDLLRSGRHSDLDSMLALAGEAKARLGHAEVRDLVARLFRGTGHAPRVYTSVLRVPFRFYLTTNYDSNIEDAYYDLYGRPLEVVVPGRAQAIYRHLRAGTPFVFKIHGSAATGEDLVISHEDYLQTIYSNRTLRYVLSAIFGMHEVVFLGYGHRDPHITRYLEYEKGVLPQGGMRRYAFVKADEFPVTMAQRLRNHGVSSVSVSTWPEVETFLNQVVFSGAADRTEISRTQYRKDYARFLREGRVECVWGAIMYAFTGSEISDGDEAARIFAIVESNELARRTIENDPALRLIFRILRAQTFKRRCDIEAARSEYADVVEVARREVGLLPLLRAVAFRYAGMFWAFPSGAEGLTARDLGLASSLLREGLSVLGSDSVRERMDIEKWLTIVAGEQGERRASAEALLALAQRNDELGFRKAAAWCRFAAANQMVCEGILDEQDAERIIGALESAYWAFAEQNNLFGIGTVMLLKAKALQALGGENQTVIRDCIEQARARAIVARDLRLIRECDAFVSELPPPASIATA